MLWFLALARRRRLRIVAYEDAAVGTLDGMRITAVELHPKVHFESDPGPAVPGASRLISAAFLPIG